MTTIYKGIQIDHSEGAAVIMKPKFKGFASDEIENGKSGLQKAKAYIDSNPLYFSKMICKDKQS